MRSWLRRLGAILVWSAAMMPSAWAGSEGDLAQRGCATLAARVTAIPGSGPVFLRSYDGPDGSGPDLSPALATAAFTYDNALAVIALVACDRMAEAGRIGAALAAAATRDRAGAQGRLRNAYRSGAQPDSPPPNGWWDAARGQWLEDAYQVGTATGNVAWAGLALLTLAERTGNSAFRDAAAQLGRWVTTQVADRRGAGGFTGGLHGDGAGEQRLLWKSTEHNTDLIALFDRLDRAGVPGPWREAGGEAGAFLDSMWEEGSGHFLTGTRPDGISANRATSGLDAQLWPLLLRQAKPAWRRALDYAARAHRVNGGFAFNDDHAGLWTEGTAQAALAYRAIGDVTAAEGLFATLSGLVSPGFYLWATPETRVSTGLALGPDSTEADFFYYHRPHLGATAWAVIAATGWNPFTGRGLGSPSSSSPGLTR
jgi:hypothetical protein